MADDEILKVNSDKPVVLMNRTVDGVQNVVPEMRSGISEAMSHLVELGHKQIAFLGGPSASWMNTKRWEMIVDLALELGVSVVEIGPNPPTLEAGRAALDRVRVSGVSGVIAYNDLMAIGLLQAAQRANLAVPGDLSIIGFDNSFGSDFTTPGLTTIRQPLLQLGVEAVKVLLKTLGDTEADVEAPLPPESLTTSLLIRESTGSPISK
jgi:LacI family transcriptional regulator